MAFAALSFCPRSDAIESQAESRCAGSWVSFYKTSHSAEERRMGHPLQNFIPVRFLGVALRRMI